MQKGPSLHFCCPQCNASVPFSLAMIRTEPTFSCPDCAAIYQFDDPTLQRQILLFMELCQQIVRSEEILSHTSVGVAVRGAEVKIPYRFLLTRLTPALELDMNGKKVSIIFRTEPKFEVDKEG